MSRISNVRVSADEGSEFVIDRTTRALAECTPVPGGWKVAVILRAGRSERRFEFRNFYKGYSPPPIDQSTVINLAAGLDGDALLLIRLSDQLLEAPTTIEALRKFAKSMQRELPREDLTPLEARHYLGFLQ